MLADLFAVGQPDLDCSSENSGGAMAALAHASYRKVPGAAPLPMFVKNERRFKRTTF